MTQPLLLVDWIDITGNDEKPWMTLEEAQAFTPAPMTTVGFLIRETPDFLTLCSTLGQEEAGNLNCIPKGCIKSKKTISL